MPAADKVKEVMKAIGGGGAGGPKAGGGFPWAKGGGILLLLSFLLPGLLESIFEVGPESRALEFEKERFGQERLGEAMMLRKESDVEARGGVERRLGQAREERMIQDRMSHEQALARIGRTSGIRGETTDILRQPSAAPFGGLGPVPRGAVNPLNQSLANLGLL